MKLNNLCAICWASNCDKHKDYIVEPRHYSKIETQYRPFFIPIQWKVYDVRIWFGDKVKHMTDEEIYEELSLMLDVFIVHYEDAVWDIFEEYFKIKEK